MYAEPSIHLVSWRISASVPGAGRFSPLPTLFAAIPAPRVVHLPAFVDPFFLRRDFIYSRSKPSSGSHWFNLKKSRTSSIRYKDSRKPPKWAFATSLLHLSTALGFLASPNCWIYRHQCQSDIYSSRQLSMLICQFYWTQPCVFLLIQYAIFSFDWWTPQPHALIFDTETRMFKQLGKLRLFVSKTTKIVVRNPLAERKFPLPRLP